MHSTFVHRWLSKCPSQVRFVWHYIVALDNSGKWHSYTMAISRLKYLKNLFKVCHCTCRSVEHQVLSLGSFLTRFTNLLKWWNLYKKQNKTKITLKTDTLWMRWTTLSIFKPPYIGCVCTLIIMMTKITVILIILIITIRIMYGINNNDGSYIDMWLEFQHHSSWFPESWRS